MRVLCFVMLLAGSRIWAAEAQLLNDPFVEHYQPEVSVSGNVVVGAMYLSAARALVDDAVGVRVATGGAQAGTVCLRAHSRDGIYSSRNVYGLPEDADGVVRLPYATAMRDVVERFGAHELALAATVGDCEGDGGSFLLVGAVGDGDGGEVVLYVNSFGATDVFAAYGTALEPCEYISEGRRTTFDFICTLSAAVVAPGAAVELVRERFGRPQPAVTIELLGVAD